MGLGMGGGTGWGRAMGKFKFNMDFVVRFKINNISGMKPMGKIPVK